MQKIPLAIAASLLLGVSAGVNADSHIPQVEIIQLDQLPAELIDLKCDPKELQRTIDEKQKASASTEYQTMLSYAQRRSDDAYSRIMANRSLRERLASEGEAAFHFPGFQPGSGSKLQAARQREHLFEGWRCVFNGHRQYLHSGLVL